MTAPKQRILLAALALSANRIVPIDELVDLLWDGAPPESWHAALHNYVARLRKSMGLAAPRLMTRSPGYALELANDAEADWREFEALAWRSQASVQAGEWDQAGTALRAALALWRGVPLIDVPCEALRREWVPALTERWLQLVEWRIDADLMLHHDSNLIVELRPLVSAYPLRERFHCQLMAALCRSGRQAEALAVYQDARRLLVTDLGIEPGPELQQMHRQVLSGARDPLIECGVRGRPCGSPPTHSMCLRR
ncbi:AfsR/SARP family transcriptional regulator [Streptacidiphilus sp. PB12-B1b]|uniref:AfsR/SARP family transcriptional regulator n=1 Tax=Streptacidiphilus sp. PB12-B1b TaxID=2705012 RepID=UPI0015F9098F|nr:AfsR/SARP family transcriptional regulator [Streptacidiphilus sp. PB12-B1b]QMU77850.1 AfsR/SARP family transcriptional regulator [Streptacidiphilus sp. PB12-B1b]